MSDQKISREALELARVISHQVWSKYDDTHGYRSQKQDYNAHIAPESDNIWAFWGQFDGSNQREFQERLKKLPAKTPGKKELLSWIKRTGITGI